MKKIILLTFLFITTQIFAGIDKGVLEATLRANKSFDIGIIDQVGSTVINKKSGETLRHHCKERSKSQECSRIIHILSLDNKDLILHDRRDKVIEQNVDFIKYRLEDFSHRESVLMFSDLDPIYNRSSGDFTGLIGGICIYEPNRCALLLLLPLTIAADIVMLPVDITINETQRHIIRRKAKLFIKDIESESELIELQNTAFLSLLRGLSQF